MRRPRPAPFRSSWRRPGEGPNTSPTETQRRHQAARQNRQARRNLKLRMALPDKPQVDEERSNAAQGQRQGEPRTYPRRPHDLNETIEEEEHDRYVDEDEALRSARHAEEIPLLPVRGIDLVGQQKGSCPHVEMVQSRLAWLRHIRHTRVRGTPAPTRPPILPRAAGCRS